MNAKKIKVGFGPQTTSNSYHQSGVKVASVLGQDERFVCGFFDWNPFQLDELSQFDVLIFIKYYPPLDMLMSLKREGKKLILDYQDMFLYPSVYEQNPWKKVLKKIYYRNHERQIRRHLELLDLCFVASPVLMEIVKEAGVRPFFLQRQLYNDSNEHVFRQHTDDTEGLILYWTGVSLNQSQNDPVLPALKELALKYRCKIIYSSDADGPHDFIEYRRWSRDSWEQEMTSVDIAFRWRDTSNMQRCKDANKVMAYMGAGLPVVVYPTESEKIIMDNGVNGFMVYSEKAFAETIEKLILNPGLRKTVGERAHNDVWQRYSLGKHVGEMKKAILRLVEA